ncbi:MAG TPA: hypothetical protein VFA94_06640, partial [Acidimicrobiales bacterium]|nr:hypothetical protein [Acidimicrobiales bacterium]
YWQGDNGGATYKGVTGDTITISIPSPNKRVVADLQAYFNNRYEFYGRKLNLVLSKDNGNENTCTDRKAQAQADDEQLHIFAATTASNGNAGQCYHSELARRKIINVSTPQEFGDDELDSYRPYLWQYMMGFDRQFQAMGELVCAHLAKQKAVHSPDPLLAARDRKYGVVLQHVIRDTDLSLQPLFDSLAKCGEKIDPAHVFRLSTNDNAGLDHPEASAAAIARLKADNVTTVFNLGIVFVEQYISSAADSQQYFPEWIFGTYGGNDLNTGIHAFWPQASQRQSIMGVGVSFPNRGINQEPAYWAMKEVDPGVDYNKDLADVGEFVLHYKAMMVLASGIQLAGPNLNPTTFERGLQAATFPYPKDDPTKSGNVGFRGDHSMTADAVEYWWSEAAVGPIGYQTDGSTGAICYIDQAARLNLGAFPKGTDPFFKGPCYAGPT